MTGQRLRWRFFGGIVISTKWNAWRNPLRQSSTLLRVDTRVDINPSWDFRYTLKRSICAIALDMPWRAWWWEKYIFLCLSLFVPQVRGSLDYARDDGIFLYCHSERKRSMSFRGHSMPEETPGKGLSPGKDTDLWWSLLCKWSFPTESEVSPKVKLRWESIQFLFTP